MVVKISDAISTNGLSHIGKTVEDLKPIVSETVLAIVKNCMEAMDQSLVKEAKAQRRQDGISIKERNVPRTINTCLGDLTYCRTYFCVRSIPLNASDATAEGHGEVSGAEEAAKPDIAKKGSESGVKQGESYLYLLDHLVGVEAYERIAKEAVAQLLQDSASVSYQKAVDNSKLGISRQTVHNRLLALHDVAADAERVEHTPKVLDLFVDEDHVHLNPKKNAIVPLVTITEGMDETDPKRHRTINPLHVAAYGMSTPDFSEMVLNVITQRYDMDEIEQVNLHADGGKWIEGLGALIPRSRMVMDGYHLEKHVRSFLRLEGAAKYASAIRSAFKSDNYESFEKNCETVFRLQRTDESKKKVRDFVEYCASHWNAIVLRSKKETCGSCTEAMVSHVLSDRLSRKPISWSHDGLQQMTMLTTYVKNGGVLNAEDIGLHQDEKAKTSMIADGYHKYRTYAEEQAKAALQKGLDWSVFEREHPDLGKVDGAFMVRKSLGSLQSLAQLAS